ncbi:MAG: flippase-like domain-containing protein [Firmicutes bacterium]|nr:flippase-like domain-containing protein [Bacillota bacterium]
MRRIDQEEAKSLPAWKKGLVISLAFSIAAALFVFFAHFEEDTLTNLLQLRAEFLLLALIAVFFLGIIEGFRIKLLAASLGHGQRISLADGVRVFLATFFFAAVTPFAAGEWPAHIVALHRSGLSLGEASAVTITRAFLTKLIFTMAAFIFLLFYREQSLPAYLYKIFLYAIFISFFMSLIFFFLLWRPVYLESLLHKIDSISWLASLLAKSNRGQRAVFFLKNEVKKFSFTAGGLNRRKAGILIVIIFLTIIYWICFFSIAPILLLGLNTTVPFFKSFTWQFVIQIVLPYIPIPGGSGVVELSLAGLFKYFVPSSVLGLFIIAWRFFTYYILLFFGGLAALGYLKL